MNKNTEKVSTETSDVEISAIIRIVLVFEELKLDKANCEVRIDDVLDYIVQRYGWQKKYARTSILERLERIADKVDGQGYSEKI